MTTNKTKWLTLGLGLACALAVRAQGREAFLLQQMQQEMQRVSGQVDMLQSNFDEVQRRMHRLEGGAEGANLRAEIQALKAEIAELRRQLSNQRGEIVRDLSGRIKTIQQAQTPPPPPPPKKVVIGPHKVYEVQSGDTLSFIAETFGTTVAKIREMNNLKSNNLRVGQKLMLPIK